MLNQFKDIDYYGRCVTLDASVLSSKMIDKLERGLWEPKTFETLREFLDSETIYVDIGSWVGVLPYWALPLAKAVVAVDPDPVCIGALERLEPYNPGHITIVRAALSDQTFVRINAVEEFGSSETSIIVTKTGLSVDVPGISVRSLMEIVGDNKAFVKIDIEGYEYIIADELASITNYTVVALQMALHPQLYENNLKGPHWLRRFETVRSTLKMATVFPGFSPYRNFMDHLKFYYYVLLCVALRKKPKGCDLVYRKCS